MSGIRYQVSGIGCRVAFSSVFESPVLNFQPSRITVLAVASVKRRLSETRLERSGPQAAGELLGIEILMHHEGAL